MARSMRREAQGPPRDPGRGAGQDLRTLPVTYSHSTGVEWTYTTCSKLHERVRECASIASIHSGAVGGCHEVKRSVRGRTLVEGRLLHKTQAASR